MASASPTQPPAVRVENDGRGKITVTYGEASTTLTPIEAWKAALDLMHAVAVEKIK